MAPDATPNDTRETSPRSNPDSLLDAALIGAVFFAFALGSIELTRIDGGLSLIWPANAAAAALLLRQPRVRLFLALPAVFLAGMFANTLVGHRSVGVEAVLNTVNLIEIAALVWVVRRQSTFKFPALTPANASGLTLLFGFLIPGASAIFGGQAAHLGLGIPAGSSWVKWWLSDAVGACMFAPPIFLFSVAGAKRLLAARYRLENVGTIILCLLCCYLAVRYVRFPFVVIAVPLTVAAFRFGGFGASILSLASSLTFLTLWVCGVRPLGLESQQEISTLANFPIIALLATILPPIAVGLGTDQRRNVARALRFNERRFRESMEHSPIGMLLLSLEGKWFYTNVALQRMLGYTPEEFLAFPPTGTSQAEDAQEVERRWQRLKSGEMESYEIERRLRHKSGRWIWVHAAVSLVRDEEGAPSHFIVQMESMEARRQAEEKLAEERERLKITLRAIADAVVTTDAGGRITYLNSAAETLLGQSLHDIEHRRVDEVLVLTDPSSGKAASNLVGQSIVHGKSFRREEPCVVHRPDGTVCYVLEVVSPVLDANALVAGTVIVLRDASSDFERARDLSHQATHDVLTGLANRLEFNRRLKETFHRATQVGVTAAVAVFDLDKFKAVNDSGGHAAGDAVLRAVAAVLRSSVRQSDIIARLGGDEFALILPNCSASRARKIGIKLLSALNPLEVEFNGTTFRTGASVGLATSSSDYLSEAQWLSAADEACYRAKREGRGIFRTTGESNPPSEASA